jgi:hypothetical protein
VRTSSKRWPASRPDARDGWTGLGAGALDLDGAHIALPLWWLRDACPCTHPRAKRHSRRGRLPRTLLPSNYPREHAPKMAQTRSHT